MNFTTEHTESTEERSEKGRQSTGETPVPRWGSEGVSVASVCSVVKSFLSFRDAAHGRRAVG